jgi:hypothetical protein
MQYATLPFQVVNPEISHAFFQQSSPFAGVKNTLRQMPSSFLQRGNVTSVTVTGNTHMKAEYQGFHEF